MVMLPLAALAEATYFGVPSRRNPSVFNCASVP
jgi:hypothetical protein